MKSIILHTRRPVYKKSVTHLFLCFSWLSFFAFLEVEKHFIHITPLRATSYVLIRLKWLEVSNRVRNWYKEKNFISWSRNWIMPIGNANIHIKINVSLFINKIVTFLFCDFNRVTSWNEAKLLFCYFHHFKFPNWNTGFIFKVNECEYKHVFS